MNKRNMFSRAFVGTAAAALVAASLAATASAPALAQPAAQKPANDVTLSVGAGQLVRLDSPMTDIFVANPAIADVQVRSANQVYIFGKGAGETTVYATNGSGRVVYSANVRVGNNIGSINEMLQVAMPESQIRVTPMNGFVLLTGTVAAPADVEDATRLTQAFVGEGTQVMNRLKTATPLQVMLQVKIAEVNRSLPKEIGVNLLTRDKSGGFLFGIGQATRDFGSIGDVDLKNFPQLDASDLYGLPAGSLKLPFNPKTGQFITSAPTEYIFKAPTKGAAINAAGRLFGLDILSALDLAQADGRVQTLAEPNLVALSGETASFLAGGEFPIPTASGINGASIEFKEYGVSLAFTPTVLEGGRISMRVRPEVSEISDDNSVLVQSYRVPSLTTRRAETTVELGSGQSFMIGGLIRNSSSNTVDKAPFLGDLPILGALFRSTGFRKDETELVIVVTPYLVKPVNAGEIALPTDGFRNSNDAERLLLNRQHNSKSGERRPLPTSDAPRTVTPVITAGAPAQQTSVQKPAAPGFSF